MPDPRPRQNFHKQSEAEINKQINLDLYTSYVYQSMAYYFDRDDVALRGFFKFFKRYSEEERENAEKFMKYLNKRGGRVVLQQIKKPDRDDWGSGLDAMKTALQLEKKVNQGLLDLQKVADTNTDPQMMDYLESEYLGQKVDTIKKICDNITNLERVGSGHGLWHFDKKLENNDDE